jgi:hypothetical protein
LQAELRWFPGDASGRRLHLDHVIASTAHGIAQALPRERFFAALQLLSDGGRELLQKAHFMAQAKRDVSRHAKYLPFESASERRAIAASHTLEEQHAAYQLAEALITETVLRAVSPYQPALVHFRFLDVCGWAASVSSRPVRSYWGPGRTKWHFELVGGAELYDATLALREAANALYGEPLELLRGLVTGSV